MRMSAKVGRGGRERKGQLWLVNAIAVNFRKGELEKGWAGSQVLNLSGDERNHWCEVRVRVLAAVPIVVLACQQWLVIRTFRRFMFFIVKMLNRRLFLFPQSATIAFRWSVNSVRPSNRYPKERQ